MRAGILDHAGIALVALSGLAAFFVFPEDLGFMTRIAVAALYVLSLDLILGYAGIASMGQAALFGSGAYAAGIASVRFVQDPILLLGIGGVAGGLVALVTGALIIRARGLTLLMLTIAVGEIVREIVNKARDYTGGSDGLAGVNAAPVLGLFRFDIYGRTGYLFALTVLILGLLVARRIVRSPFGLACRGVKEDALRVTALGGKSRRYLLAMYGISGVFAGVAGAVGTITSGIVGLDSVSFSWSAEALVMLVLGGAGRLYGAIVGAVGFMTIHHILSAADPFRWMLVIGAMLVAIVVFWPGGIMAALDPLARLLRRPAGAAR